MKKLLCIALMLVVGSFWACKKSEENKSSDGKNVTSTKEAKPPKRKRRAKGPRQNFKIYQRDQLAVEIPKAEYDKLMTTTVQMQGKDQKAILLTDLLKSHNLTGKFVILRGPTRTANLTWEQVKSIPIYLYPVKNRVQVFHESKVLKAADVPNIVMRIDVADKPADVEPAQKVAEKKSDQ